MYALTFQVRETTGRAAAVITSSGFDLATGRPAPLLTGLPITVGAGAVLAPGTIRVRDEAPRNPARQVTISLTYTDATSESRVVSMTANVMPE